MKKKEVSFDKYNFIIYINESGIKNTLRNEYTWDPRGELVKDERKGSGLKVLIQHGN